MIESGTIHMIGTDGRVRNVPMYLKKSLLAQGFHIIVNPKEDYYPQYDQSNPNFSKDNEIIENVEEKDFLEVERV